MSVARLAPNFSRRRGGWHRVRAGREMCVSRLGLCRGFASLLTSPPRPQAEAVFFRRRVVAERVSEKRSSIGPYGRTDERSSCTLEAGDGTRTRDIQLGKLWAGFASHCEAMA